jgi:Flp pilus assembly protein TadD
MYVYSLKAVLNRKPSAKLRTLLAKALASQSKYGEAVEQLHLAISLHPQDCVEASQVCLPYIRACHAVISNFCDW